MLILTDELVPNTERITLVHSCCCWLKVAQHDLNDPLELEPILELLDRAGILSLNLGLQGPTKRVSDKGHNIFRNIATTPSVQRFINQVGCQV